MSPDFLSFLFILISGYQEYDDADAVDPAGEFCKVFVLTVNLDGY